MSYCEQIVPYVEFYKKQIKYYSHTTYEILTNEIGLILPTFPKENRYKRGIIPSLVRGFTGLAYEGISSFLLHKRLKALHKAVSVMEKKVDMQHNSVFHLEDSMIMYGIYTSDTLEKIIETVHKMHNNTSWHERAFAGKLNHWFECYLSKDGVGHYTINSVLYLTTMREKYVRMYE